MNLNQFHQNEKEVSTKLMFTGEGEVISLQIQANGQLKEHITTVPALLICIDGLATFENEFGFIRKISSGDFIEIEPNVKHWVNAETTANFVLIK